MKFAGVTYENIKKDTYKAYLELKKQRNSV